MDWLETKYINLSSSRLDRFKKVNNNYNFRCPFCGDSKKDPRKARGWLIDKTPVIYYCHNCNTSMGFKKFLKSIDDTLYIEYIKEGMTNNHTIKPEPKIISEKPVFKPKTKIDLKKISQLKPDNPAKIRVQNRLIPPESHHRLYLAIKFKEWVNTIIPNKFSSLKNDEPRLVIPFFDEEGRMFGFTGRSFKKNSDLRYITIMIDEDMPKIFGLDKIDKNKDVYVTEGPIDSLFLPNCLASCGGDLTSDLLELDIDISKFVVIYDNEPRNEFTVKKMNKAIDRGYRVCIWPEYIKQKDINDMILFGLSKEKILEIVKANTFKGLEAKLKMSTWSKA